MQKKRCAPRTSHYEDDNTNHPTKSSLVSTGVAIYIYLGKGSYIRDSTLTRLPCGPQCQWLDHTGEGVWDGIFIFAQKRTSIFLKKTLRRHYTSLWPLGPILQDTLQRSNWYAKYCASQVRTKDLTPSGRLPKWPIFHVLFFLNYK